MWRKDVEDTITGCKVYEKPFDMYLMGYEGPNHPLPVTIRESYRATSYLCKFDFHMERIRSLHITR